MNPVLAITDVKKSFSAGFIPRKKEILKGISFEVGEGEIFGYLGPNGAGKTTTIKCVLGLIFPDAGTIALFGRPPSRSRGPRIALGFLPENPYFYDYLTAREFLDFYGQLFGIPKPSARRRIARLLKLVDMERAADLPLRKFSRGMLQRIGLAQALINEPALVILDEPLGGLDPLGRKEIRDVILRLRDAGQDRLPLVPHPPGHRDDLRPRGDHRRRTDPEPGAAHRPHLGEGPLHRNHGLGRRPSRTWPRSARASRRRPAGRSSRSPRRRKIQAVLDLVRAKHGKVHSLIPRTQTLEDLFVDMVKPQ